MRNALIGGKATINQELVVVRRVFVVNHLGRILILVVIFAGVFFNWFNWVPKLADIHTGCLRVLLQMLTQLFQVVMEVC